MRSRDRFVHTKIGNSSSRRPIHGTGHHGADSNSGLVNPIERTVRTVDAWQQRHAVSAFAFAVVKKFGDDQGGNLVALLTYFAFLATFPLLLALSAILGLAVRGDPSLQARLQKSALAEFPIIGTQLKSQIGVSALGHSGPALILGILGAILGGRGLANAVQNTFNSVWNVPKVELPDSRSTTFVPSDCSAYLASEPFLPRQPPR